MAYQVAVTRIIPESGMNLLKAADDYNLRIWEHELPPTPEELEKLLDGCDGALTLLTDKISPEVMDRHPSLRVVSNFAVGFDNIDIAAATERGVLVGNTPGVLTETTADATWALLMAAARRIVEGEDYVRAGKWKTWGPTLLMGQDIHHATIGIVGFGRIGKEVAKRARGFDMEILCHDTYQDTAAAAEYGATFTDMEDLLRRSDFVTLHVALTPETRHMISGPQFAMMKDSAVLVNAARGPVVDTDALVTALREGQIFAAGLDVTDPEPLPADHALIGMANCVVVPHIASATINTRNKMAEIAATNLLNGLRGEKMPGLVNPQAVGKRG